MRMFQTTTLFALLSLALGGCMGSPGEASGAPSWLVEVSPDTEPLDTVETEEWQGAPDCENRLGGTVSFAIADDGRVAAVDANGHVVCVDSVEEVQDELAEDGRVSDADDLGDAYLVTIGRGYVPSAEDIVAGDPSPQPSMPYGDPSPQPSMQ